MRVLQRFNLECSGLCRFVEAKMKFVPLHWTAAVAPNVLKRHPPSNAVRGRLRNSSDADLLHSSQESPDTA
jgi:hypothetical protein